MRGNRNAPALRKRESVECLLGGDIDTPNTVIVRAQVLSRFGIPASRVGMFGAFIYGEAS